MGLNGRFGSGFDNACLGRSDLSLGPRDTCTSPSALAANECVGLRALNGTMFANTRIQEARQHCTSRRWRACRPLCVSLPSKHLNHARHTEYVVTLCMTEGLVVEVVVFRITVIVLLAQVGVIGETSNLVQLTRGCKSRRQGNTVTFIAVALATDCSATEKTIASDDLQISARNGARFVEETNLASAFQVCLHSCCTSYRF